MCMSFFCSILNPLQAESFPVPTHPPFPQLKLLRQGCQWPPCCCVQWAGLGLHLTCSFSSSDILDDFCHLLWEERSSLGFPPTSPACLFSVCVSSSLCLLSASCSSRRRHTHVYELLISQHTSLTFPFSITVAPIFCLLRPKTLKLSLILFFLTSEPVFQEIVLVLPSRFIWDLIISYSFHCCHPFTSHLDYSSSFLTDLLPSSLTPPGVCSYKEVE